jgi:hypothetical protein
LFVHLAPLTPIRLLAEKGCFGASSVRALALMACRTGPRSCGRFS